MWVESIVVASGCGCKEVYYMYIDFLILLIPTFRVSVLFLSSISKMFFVLVPVLFCN